ncbi:MAG: amidohydrolase family protein [Spirochaetales bacterium]|uniref:Amidohydrolase family protein n=1 Tax=Candidatus Thalassospirochaeta sargassi TaxID=3119039 RepID=A0AAJ1IG74_9SPIO|nr:amidohydrolase family protein [Spirochaetales bacterium]
MPGNMSYSGRIIDIHTHVQPATVIADRRPFVETEPDFKTLYENPKYTLSSSRDVLKHMEQCGVEASVILGFAWRDPKLLAMHNDMILADCRKQHPGLYGFTCIYPFAPGRGAADEAERCLDAGASGIGEVGLYDRDLDTEYIDAMEPVMKAALEREKPVMMHVNEPIGHNYSGKAPMTISGIYNFVKAYPDNRIILAHWGGGLFFFHSLKKEAKQLLKNVWYDSAASPYLYDKTIWKTAVDIIGPERILLGTDFPLLSIDRYIKELDASGLGREELEMICCRNAEGLLNLD